MEEVGEEALKDPGDRGGHIVCLVAGARVMTEQGLIAVEALCPGDRVLTLDDGLQTLRRCQRVSVASQGPFAAVSVPAGTFGNHGALRVAPQHRILLTGWQAELYCGEDEVLVEAAELVRSGLLRQDRSGCEVTYFHLRLDRPALLNVEGLWSESFLSCQRTPARPERALTAEVLVLSPKDRVHANARPAREVAPAADHAAQRMPHPRHGIGLGRMMAATCRPLRQYDLTGRSHGPRRINRATAR